jgi:hypothetical protein
MAEPIRCNRQAKLRQPMTTGRTGVGQQLMLACGPLGSADGAMRYGSLHVVTCRCPAASRPLSRASSGFQIRRLAISRRAPQKGGSPMLKRALEAPTLAGALVHMATMMKPRSLLAIAVR